ncbi:hypothetical protein WA026_017051 [Henosepilachna vigintioctopunctata]|uniref:Caspase-8 n=1 Tax=Henosepilachna vigintioctopunctata TaxID=420089 RepID=A0AAW1TUI9_9CUCU
MGNFMSNLNNKDEEPDFSSTDETEIEENYAMNESNDDVSNRNVDTDAINPHSNSAKGLEFDAISLHHVTEIEESLADYEKVSLIFLLSENVQDCLDAISIYEWAKKETKNNNTWRGKIIEALAIIQNYQIPKKYGFTKTQLEQEFFPLLYFTSKYINTFRKIVYCFCEKLTTEHEDCFLRNIENDMINNHFEFHRYIFMEMNFSYFLKIGYISQTNVQSLLKILKTMDNECLYDMLKMVHPKETLLEGYSYKETLNDQDINLNAFIENRSPELKFINNSSLFESNVSNSTQDNNQNSKENLAKISSNKSKDSEDIYDLTRKRIAFIIDQENFYTEPNPKYKDLLPENIETQKLHTRMGTSLDSGKLEETLNKRNFIVKSQRNLTHLKIISELEATVNEIDEKNCSCFLVSILSHGDEGVIYGCNSCHVEVSTIIEIMSDTKLNKIPKVLILQSCQGPNLQKSRRIDTNLEVDGPSLRGQPSMKIPDFLIFWATVPGFSAIRNKISGTWFIQSLCNHLEEADNREHFEEICTKIIRDVSNKKFQKDDDEYYMVPFKNTTLTKKLFL